MQNGLLRLGIDYIATLCGAVLLMLMFAPAYVAIALDEAFFATQRRRRQTNTFAGWLNAWRKGSLIGAAIGCVPALLEISTVMAAMAIDNISLSWSSLMCLYLGTTIGGALGLLVTPDETPVSNPTLNPTETARRRL